MKIADVKKLSPLDRIVYFIQERESIRLKKESGAPAPWTDDEILRAYRFTNVRRMDDRVSRWLLENWYEPNRDHPNMLAAVALARLVNNPPALERVGFPKRWNPDRIQMRLVQYRAEGHAVFNAAYMVRGGAKGGDKIVEVVDDYAGPLLKLQDELDRSSMQASWTLVESCYGFGSFMAGQVVADLRWALTGEWKDKSVWAPIGPGSKKGMNYLREQPVTTPISQLEFTELLQDLIAELNSRLPAAITSRLEAIDYQNVCCEFSKYSRTLLDDGRPKQLYPGAG